MIITYNDFKQFIPCALGVNMFVNTFKGVLELPDSSEITITTSFKDQAMWLFKSLKQKLYNTTITIVSGDVVWFKGIYDSCGNLVWSLDHNNITTYSYDQNNNMIKLENNFGCWELYTYDQNNNMITTKCSTNYCIDVKYTYDQNNNVITKIYTHNQICDRVEHYTYDQNNNVVERLIEIISTNSDSPCEDGCIKDGTSNCVTYRHSFTYDQNNNLIKRVDDDDDYTHSHITNYEYDQNNNLIKLSDNNTYWEKWEYNENNIPIKFQDSDNGMLVMSLNYFKISIG